MSASEIPKGQEAAFKNAAPFKASAQAAKAADEVDVAAAAVQKRIELKTASNLDDLQRAMGIMKFIEMMRLVNTLFEGGKAVEGEFDLVKDFNKTTVFKAAEKDISAKLLALFTTDANRSKFDKILDSVKSYAEKDGKEIQTTDLQLALSTIYAASARQSLKSKFEDRKYGEFMEKKAVEGKTFPMQYRISFDKDTLVADITSTDEVYKAEYAKFDKDNQVSAGVADEDKRAAKSRIDRARKFKTSFAGKLMGLLGIVEVAEGPVGESAELRKVREDEAYAEVLKGDNIIAKWFIYFFGGGAMIDGGTADVEEALAGLDPKFAPMVDQLKTMAATSPLNLKKMAEQMPGTAEKMLALGREEFNKLIGHPDNLPGKTFVTAAGIKAPSRGLKVVLEDGATMFVPGGETITIGSETKEIVKEGQTFDKTLIVNGDLPVGVKFNDKVKFEEVGEERQAADGVVEPVPPAADASVSAA